jgi:hypothetical protein
VSMTESEERAERRARQRELADRLTPRVSWMGSSSRSMPGRCRWAAMRAC